MGTWQNSDGLYIRLGPDEGGTSTGGQLKTFGSLQEEEFVINYTDLLSATNQLPPSSKAFGIMLPSGARIEEVETVVETLFTSSGTLASSTIQIGLNKNDRTTALSNTALLSAATGATLALQTVGSKVVTRAGSTGAGAYIGTNLSEQGVVTVCNTAHASHPFTAGRIRVRIRYLFP